MGYGPVPFLRESSIQIELENSVSLQNLIVSRIVKQDQTLGSLKLMIAEPDCYRDCERLRDINPTSEEGDRNQ